MMMRIILTHEQIKANDCDSKLKHSYVGQTQILSELQWRNHVIGCVKVLAQCTQEENNIHNKIHD